MLTGDPCSSKGYLALNRFPLFKSASGAFHFSDVVDREWNFAGCFAHLDRHFANFFSRRFCFGLERFNITADGNDKTIHGVFYTLTAFVNGLSDFSEQQFDFFEV